MAPKQLSADYWRGRRVLVTGHTGFKGSWISAWLKMLGANLIGLSDSASNYPSHYESISKIFDKDLRGDVRDLEALKKIIHEN